MGPEKNRRILVIDDNLAIHDDFRKILASKHDASGLEEGERLLFGEHHGKGRESYNVDSAFQGQEGYDKVRTGLATGRRYALAFVDTRMPPGWDGLRTIQKIWEADGDIQVVMCTAHGDYSWDEVIRTLGTTDRLLILKKPFDAPEVCQLACALTEKWHLANHAHLKLNQLESMVEQQTHRLNVTNRQLKMAEEQLRHDAHHDALTGLANRALVTERLERCMLRARRNPTPFALLFLDLDRFKVVNDTLGHLIGDQLLVGIANRLSASVRASDTVAVNDGHCLARVGGDEFVVLLEGLRDPTDAIRVAERIVDALNRPFELDGHELYSPTSIGIALSIRGYERAEDMLRDADTALHAAKSAGKGCYQIFNEEMHGETLARWRLESELRRAIERGELLLHFQPIVSVQSREIKELEALVRWQHPKRGLVPPGQFIPLAEETGLIVPLGYWVMQRACEHLQEWEARSAGTYSIGVNVSGKQFGKRDFVGQIAKILNETGVDPRRLRLEITESAMMNVSSAMPTLNQLRDLNLEFHLDDFGTGYSSLSYLHRMPVDALKIDRSFVNAMGDDPMSRSIVHAIVTLAHTLGKRVIAEGVETAAQLDQLAAMKCDYAQGYHLFKPMSAEAAGELVTSARSLEQAFGT